MFSEFTLQLNEFGRIYTICLTAISIRVEFVDQSLNMFGFHPQIHPNLSEIYEYAHTVKGVMWATFAPRKRGTPSMRR